MTFLEAIEQVVEQVACNVSPKMGNPLYRFIYSVSGKSVSFSSHERQVDENCRRLRAFVGDYVTRRISGQNSSTVKGSSDLLSLFLQVPDIFTHEFIIDELMDFFAAATKTTQFAS